MTRPTHPTVVVPVPVSVMVDPARSAHPIPTHRVRPRAREALSQRQTPAARRMNPPEMVPEPASVMVVPVPVSIRRHRGRPPARSAHRTAHPRRGSTVTQRRRRQHQRQATTGEGNTGEGNPGEGNPGEGNHRQPRWQHPEGNPGTEGNPGPEDPRDPGSCESECPPPCHRHRVAKPSGYVATPPGTESGGPWPGPVVKIPTPPPITKRVPPTWHPPTPTLEPPPAVTPEPTPVDHRDTPGNRGAGHCRSPGFGARSDHRSSRSAATGRSSRGAAGGRATSRGHLSHQPRWYRHRGTDIDSSSS